MIPWHSILYYDDDRWLDKSTLIKMHDGSLKREELR